MVLTTDLTLRIVFILVAAMVDGVRQFRHAKQNDDIPLLVAELLCRSSDARRIPNL